MCYATLHVPQSSILEPLPFLVYINNFNNASVLHPVTFVDDANLFYFHQNIKNVFGTFNYELQK